MPTIKDVAQHAGVSITTVSHVLNETRHVSADLIARVKQAVDTLGYQPNAVARSLRRKETRILGMVVPDNSNPYFGEVARSIEDACFALGYNIILCNSDEDPEKERAYVDVLIENQVDGIVFVLSGSQDEHLRPIRERKIPLVAMDRELPHFVWDSVLIDNRDGARQVTSHLIKQRHTRIACISGPAGLTPSIERVGGYRDALHAAGLDPNGALLKVADFRPEGGYAAMQELLELPTPPTAVFACNDFMAMGAMRAITERGQRIPQDVSVVGFDDIALASYTYPSLTTVAQQYEAKGKLVVELLTKRINGDVSKPQQHRLKPRLVVRESSQPLRVSSKGQHKAGERAQKPAKVS
jgi:LacI family transcriptional regulator